MSKKPFFKDNEWIQADGEYRQRYKVIQRVRVSDSEVYFCTDTKNDNKVVVLKAEAIGSQPLRKKTRLHMEWTFYERLSQSEDFDIALDHFYGYNHKFLVLKKRGIDLRRHYIRLNNLELWEDRHLKLYAIQMIAGLEKCHFYGVIHLDPKPNNYVLDEKNSSKIYLIDFDVAKDYLRDDGQHIPYRTGLKATEVSGNQQFLSLNGHNGVEQSRRDDMIFLGYSLIWMARGGGLPWDGRTQRDFKSRKEYNEWLRVEKTNTCLEILCQEFQPLIQYMRYCTELDFEAKPNYQFLISLFE